MRTLKTLLILILAITFFNCSNDDDINNPPVNANGCNYQGLTFEDNANNTMTLIPESDLTTDFLCCDFKCSRNRNFNVKWYKLHCQCGLSDSRNDSRR